MATDTPLMTQYEQMKRKHPDAILLFRVGDFYETFSDDAIAASEILGITLTRRGNGKSGPIPLAGFPHHALDTYLPKLVRAGKRVAICEQLEDPKQTKKLVKRGITELVTPGVNTSDSVMNTPENNFLAGIHVGRKQVGVAFLDISTGEFLCAQGDDTYVDKLLADMAPRELLRMRGLRDYCDNHFTLRCPTYELDDWVYTDQTARGRLLKHFDVQTLKGFGVDGMGEAVIAAGSLLHYLDLTQHTETAHITSLARLDEDRYVRLDRFTVRNLELHEPLNPEGWSLRQVIDRTLTPMGRRMLGRWLQFPLIDQENINARLDAVEHFYANPELRSQLTDTLRGIGDIEKLVCKISSRRIGPREMLHLRDAIDNISHICSLLAGCGCDVLEKLNGRYNNLDALARRIERTITDDPPATFGKGGGEVIRAGVDIELDKMRSFAHDSKSALQQIVNREIQATGITSLKISNNNVFGYYIEVRNTHRSKVPPEWIRKQTLVNAERYITPELKEYEQKILHAQEGIGIAESRIYNGLLDELTRHIGELQNNAVLTARIDCLCGLGTVAADNGYVRPVLDKDRKLSIRQGRHPVIERRLPPGQSYIANDVELDPEETQIMMITGPNMSGKSALLRQTALIVLMAQTGSFVPATEAHIGITDKIFTRVGASDNISLGESTFMVEMTEAAAILNNMSDRSLILFDELGRGTSTYDGISIAWAIVEHIHNNKRCRPKTLFATHYHELNEMEKTYPRVVNYNVSVRDIDGKVVFMRKLERGGSEHSFGIHVAKLAGMPPAIVKRASQVLRQLEKNAPRDPGGKPALTAPVPDACQMSIFQLDDPLLSQLRDRLLDLNIDNLTPRQALDLLYDMRSLLTGSD
ncbi:MAG: DNA mismatch repair protein MutS [Muribaculaceae bacterium]|nr:DNA mismatch repair protein MutS [Muribaculaceae bacterium]